MREITVEDLPALREVYSEKGVTDFLEPLYEEEEEIAYTKAYIENRYRFFEYGMWVVIDKISGKLIGRAGLENRDVAVGYTMQGEPVYESQVELGYLIAPSCQRRGYGYEVCSAILLYAKEELEIQTVNAFIQMENEPSRRLAEKLGFCLDVSGSFEEAGEMMLCYRRTNEL